mgnify:CR=1 FL=1
MKRIVDLSVGFLMIFGVLCLLYLSASFGNVNLLGADQYTVETYFSDVTGLNENTDVQLIGIKVGHVENIKLTDDFEARVVLSIDRHVNLPEDTIISVKTQGLLGERYVALSPGGLPPIPKDGSGQLMETQPPIILEDLLGKAIFGATE